MVLCRVIYYYGLVLLAVCVHARVHRLSFKNDPRPYVEVSTFGYSKHGFMSMQIANFSVAGKGARSGKVGFSLNKGDEVSELMRSQPTDCALEESLNPKPDLDMLFFLFDLNENRIKVRQKGLAANSLQICDSAIRELSDPCRSISGKERTEKVVVSNVNDDEDLKRLLSSSKAKRRASPSSTTTHGTDQSLTSVASTSTTGVQDNSEEMSVGEIPIKDGYVEFSVIFKNKGSQGTYNLIFHNCHNYEEGATPSKISMQVVVIERNGESYLSAGDILKPKLYIGVSVLFFVTAFIWLFVLKCSSGEIFRIHYVMAALVILKSLSLLFHGVNYYFIGKYGHQQEVWAVFYYIMHLLKGALLFGTVILIGTGYTFFKNFLTERDKKVFMIVIPLQVLDNIALIIVEESEVAQDYFRFWFQLFIFVDLICCAAIILPVVWSIRHLQDASGTDGKAAFSLEKLKLFRHFYIIVICYIYLTRILKYLIAFTVPFRFTWLVVTVEELGTWVFFVVSGFQFRPTPNNPYLKLSQSDDELEMDEVLTQSGATEAVVKLKRGKAAAVTEESSHDYD